MKKVIIILLIFSLIFISFFAFKKEEEKTNKNISVILETEEGNIKSDTFPSNEEYEYLSTECENTSNLVNVNFNKETWKLNLKIEEESVDGNFYCNIYFKEKSKLASDVIIRKYEEDNLEGLIKLNQPETEQTPALVEYRYSGSNEEVKNYVNFNNETWRIIGVSPVDGGTGNYENRLKLIREESIGDYSWDTSATSINSGNGINQWGESGTYNGADIMRLLNPGYIGVNGSLYYNRTTGKCYNARNNVSVSCDFTSTGLTEEAKNMIGDAKWYTAAVSYYNMLSNDVYIMERGSEVGTKDSGVSITKTISWVGKVALIYASDYAYSSKECYKNVVLNDNNNSINDYRAENCVNSSWMPKTYIRLISPLRATTSDALSKRSTGQMTSHYCVHLPAIYPSLYLKSTVEIISGDGTIDFPYELAIS